MRIGFVAQPFDNLRPPVEGGSLAIWIYQVALRCAARGHDVTVFANHGGRLRERSLTRDGVRYVLTPTAVNALGNRVCRAAARRRAASAAVPEFGAWWSDAGYGHAAGRAARRLGCEVIHIMNYSQLAPVIRRTNPRAKICLHMECEWLTQLDRGVVEARLPAIDLVIGCSEYITETIAKRFPDHAHRFVTVPNAAAFVPEYDRSETEPGRVLFVGRVSPEKGVHVLVEAFHRVLQRFPSATLRIAGGIGSAPLEYLVGLSDDPKVKALAAFYPARPAGSKDPYGEWLERAAGTELGKRIVFEGRVDHSGVGDHYRRASVLVNPSLSEAFGMSLVEAMMYRIPVVASRVGGMTNIVEDGRTGLLVEPADAEALAAAICELLGDERKRQAMGDAGRHRAVERYSWERTSDLLLEHFQAAPGPA